MAGLDRIHTDFFKSFRETNNGSAPINSLEYPRYEFYYPWDYAAEKEKKFISNHEFIRALKRRAQSSFIQRLSQGGSVSSELQDSFAAEEAYLAGFQRFGTTAYVRESSRFTLIWLPEAEV